MEEWIRKLVALSLLVTVVICAASGHVLAEEKTQAEEASELGQGRIWIPRVTFPPSDPTAEAGYLFLFDRDLSIKSGKFNLYLSKKRALELTVDDSDFYLRLHGRIYLDLVKYFEDKIDLGSSGIGLRTLQLEADGRFSQKWLYRLSVGGLTSGGRFDGSGAFLDDAYLSYVGKRAAWIFGQQGEPFSLEEATSSLAMTFMERALSNALAPGNNVGVSFHTTRKRFSLSAGLFGEDLASPKDIEDQGLGLTGRFTFRPQHAEETIYHLGGSFSWRVITRDDTVSYRYRPEAGLTDVRYVNTGDIPGGNNIARIGLEGAIAAGPLSFQAEYIWMTIDRSGRYDNLAFDGWYAFVSWFPTGESRKYFPDEGIFGYPEITSKWGAVELAARYSTLDLNDGSITGGQEDNVTFGVNWYISPQVRLMGNYILVFCDENADDNGKVLGDDSPQILQMRLQMRF